MSKEFAKYVIGLSNENLNKLLVVEAIEKLSEDINYMEYARSTFNPAAQTQESIEEAKQLLRRLKELLC